MCPPAAPRERGAAPTGRHPGPSPRRLRGRRHPARRRHALDCARCRPARSSVRNPVRRPARSPVRSPVRCQARRSSPRARRRRVRHQHQQPARDPARHPTGSPTRRPAPGRTRWRNRRPVGSEAAERLPPETGTPPPSWRPTRSTSRSARRNRTARHGVPATGPRRRGHPRRPSGPPCRPRPSGAAGPPWTRDRRRRPAYPRSPPHRPHHPSAPLRRPRRNGRPGSLRCARTPCPRWRRRTAAPTSRPRDRWAFPLLAHAPDCPLRGPDENGASGKCATTRVSNSGPSDVLNASAKHGTTKVAGRFHPHGRTARRHGVTQAHIPYAPLRVMSPDHVLERFPRRGVVADRPESARRSWTSAVDDQWMITCFRRGHTLAE